MKKSNLDDSYISSEEREIDSVATTNKTNHAFNVFNTEEEIKASKVPDLIYKTDKTSQIVDDRSWGDGNPCYVVYYIPNKNIHVKLEGIFNEHESPKQQWYRSFICKQIIKEYTEYEEIKIERPNPSNVCSPKTKEQIIEMVNQGYQSDLDLLGDEYDYGKAFSVNGNDPGHEFVNLVEEGSEPTGHEGESNIFRIYYIPSYELYIKVLGFYSSYENTSWNSMCFVKKVTKQRTVYV